MTAFHPIHIHVRWSSTHGAFMLWPNPVKRTQECVRLLFAEHEPSVYGTFIRTETVAVGPAIVLPAIWAMDYWRHPAINPYASIQWENDIAIYAELAELIEQALMQGHIRPDYEAWRNGKIAWLITWPEQQEHVLPHLHEERWIIAEQWLTSIIEQYVSEEMTDLELGGLRKARFTLERCKSAITMLRAWHPNDWLDEDDWLLALGYEADPAPFRLALQLVEPTDSDLWRLNVLVRNKTTDEHTFVCTPSGHILSGECPPSWEEQFASRLAKEVRKWLRIAPGLQQEGAPGQMLEHLHDEQAWQFLMTWSDSLLQAGVTVLLPSWWHRARRPQPVLKARIRPFTASSGTINLGLQQLMDFDWRVSIGELELTEAEYEALLKQRTHLANIRGQWIVVDRSMLLSIRRKLQQLKQAGGVSLQEILRHELLSDQAAQVTEDNGAWYGDETFAFELELDEGAEQMLRPLLRFAKPPLVRVPRKLRGTLRKYQVEGYSWLVRMRTLGFGACLADDMGLGKTLQWIAYLLHLQETEPGGSPSLLICPTSVLGNWQKELERFAPSLRVYLHHGPQRLKGQAFVQAAAESDVVLTSYPLAHLDKQELTCFHWKSICLDEAQNIKNAMTKQSQAIRNLQGEHRAALTGTPLENRLSELWSIMNFIVPGYLGSFRSFNRTAQAIEKQQDEQAIKRLQLLVKPFLLRRVKDDQAIALDLPDKKEIKCYVSLTPEQSLLYEQQLDILFGRIERLSSMERRGSVLSTIMKLKQLCNHPAMLERDFSGSADAMIARSNKLLRLVEMVEEVREAGERCLIFTQFVDMGRLLQSVLQRRLQERVLFMHGGIAKKNRDEMIADFQQQGDPSPCGVFILSLKTGGTGLNLTAANHVFHYDRWWNPAVENQASDRVYRIGQKKNVFVHKFISLGTLEERIDEMLEHKLGLSRKIVGTGEQWISELTTDELRDMLRLQHH